MPFISNFPSHTIGPTLSSLFWTLSQTYHPELILPLENWLVFTKLIYFHPYIWGHPIIFGFFVIRFDHAIELYADSQTWMEVEPYDLDLKWPQYSTVLGKVVIDPRASIRNAAECAVRNEAWSEGLGPCGSDLKDIISLTQFLSSLSASWLPKNRISPPPYFPHHVTSALELPD